jgi:hypothetical protein
MINGFETVMTRRDLLELLLAAGVGSIAGPRPAGGQPMSDLAVVDHFVWGAPDLDAGVRWLEARTGVTPAIGGSHPGRGTRNALISLGRRQYFEVLAPDPAQQPLPAGGAALAALREPRLQTWAAGARDIEALAARLRQTRYAVSAIQPGSRRRPDGALLQWRTLGVTAPGGALIPFFIEWAAGTRHPSEDSPQGCSLSSFHLEHPDAAAVREALAALGLPIDVRDAAEARLRVTLDTPRGRVEV